MRFYFGPQFSKDFDTYFPDFQESTIFMHSVLRNPKMSIYCRFLRFWSHCAMVNAKERPEIQLLQRIQPALCIEPCYRGEASWVNPTEVKVIGITTPYQLYVRQIREMIKQDETRVLPQIGFVEEFQGQKRIIILISTVRTSVNKLEYDWKSTLDFVKKSKGRNIAISWARALIVIVNPTGSIWAISYMAENGTYHGPLEDFIEASGEGKKVEVKDN